jgi:dTMP kinase
MVGFFLTFEGVEGGGKTTQVTLLAEALRAQGREVFITREPGGTEVGQVLRRILLEPATPLASEAELLLMLADRAQHVHEVILPGLRADKVIISDRFLDSTIAYQGYGRGIPLDVLARLNAFVCSECMPALTLILDLAVTAGLQRANKRRGVVEKTDTFEAEAVDFHERVRAGFLAVANAQPERVCLIKADRPVEVVHREILATVRERMGEMKRET